MDKLDEQGRGLSTTVWTQLDRKAGAITELTIRQLRNRISTWVVLGVGVLLISLLIIFYIDSIRDEFEPYDNDGDSEDWDNDGYPLGQERIYGTSDYDESNFPGSSEYIYQGDIDYNDQPRNHYGNHTWIDAWGYFTPTWIDTDTSNPFSGFSTDYRWIDWNLEPIICEDSSMSDDPFEAYDWGLLSKNYCLYENGTYVMFGAIFIGEGDFFVEPGWDAQWGYLTEPFFVEKHPKSMYIDEDDIDWDGTTISSSQGFDDDGDCLKEDYLVESSPDDSNRNGIVCDVQWTYDPYGNLVSIRADSNVDEDPDDSKHIGESSHRTFIIGTGKIAFVMILGLFLPLFLALGLVRDESENGTLHYLLSKPIHRGEFILYRLLGYLAVVVSYTVILTFIIAFITSIIGPGDSIIRLSDYPVWLGISLSTILVLTAYGSVFNTVGLILPRYGVYLCILFGVWEFLMGLFTITIPSSDITMLSISHWAIQIIDATVMIAWSDTALMQQQANAFGLETGISFFWHPPVHTLGTGNPFIALIISVVFILVFSIGMILIGQLIFRNKEIM
ncbi:MAG: ABC transporter permease [Candidatus Thalassarchaeaceae archaeon]|nr:ABC transporter permease [Candidatus Thalassarchaeaceae archaeon]|tara:strand:- start:2648 stop:4324 length:1677 start_codon:yes stop_codon:yes gene_type:complete